MQRSNFGARQTCAPACSPPRTCAFPEMTGEMKTDETKTCGSVRAGCGQHHAASAGSSKKTDDKKDGRLTLEPAQGFTSSTDESWKAKMNVEMDECFEARWSCGPSGWLLTFEPVRGVTAEALEAARAKWLAGVRVSSEPAHGFICKACKGTGLTELEPEKGDAGTGSGKAHEGKGTQGHEDSGKARHTRTRGTDSGKAHEDTRRSRSRSRARKAPATCN